MLVRGNFKMATSRSCFSRSLTCKISFDGILQPDVRSFLVVEIIKYFLYQREQIPLPFDQFKRREKV